MTAVVAVVVRCGRGSTECVVGDVGGGRHDRPPRPFGWRTVMIAHTRASCRFGMVESARQWQMQPPVVNACGARSSGSMAPPGL
jgi:hypothetical protein